MAMASMTMASGSDGGREGWRYVFEALQNVRALQLLLFHATLTPSDDCRSFTAVVRHGSLRCTWESPHGMANWLSVSLPACLLDLTVPACCWTRHDHVEVRLGLLSLDPALHGLWMSLEDQNPDLDACRREDLDTKPFSMDCDAQALESGEGVQFFCRKCSSKLTNTPFRRVLEVPSMDWREVSEHFYGNCCCASFGAQAEFLVARFQQLLTPSEETCLVASTTCIVHKGDVIASEDNRDPFLESNAARSLGSSQVDSDPCVIADPGVASHIEVKAAHVHTSGLEGLNQKTSGSPGTDSKLIRHQNGVEEVTSVSVAKGIQDVRVDGSKASPEEFGSRAHYDREEDPCCLSSCSSRRTASTESSALNEASPESLGNAFMTGPGSQSEEHTLERLFTHELQRNSESNSSYRYVVRSFQTGAPLLQLVLLNQSALISSGTCHLTSILNTGDATANTGDTLETTKRKFLDRVSGFQTEDGKIHETLDRKPANVSLKKVAKFMFCDCRMVNSDELRLIDKWAQLQNADDIFMLDEVAGTLIDFLKFHQMAFPPSCQSFEQFSLSFLTK